MPLVARSVDLLASHALPRNDRPAGAGPRPMGLFRAGHGDARRLADSSIAIVTSLAELEERVLPIRTMLT